MDNLDFLDSPEGGNEAAQPVETTETQSEAQAEAAPEPTQEEQPQATETPSRERDEKGRFKPKDEQPKEEPVMVPLAALHETRDKVKALEAQLAQFSQPQQNQPQPVPDVFENPEGFYQHIQNQIAQTALNDRLNLSEEMMRQSAGNDVVEAAQEWARNQFQADPALAQAFYQQRNPYGFLVQQYQRHQALAALGDDHKEIEAFKAWKAAQAQLQQQQPETETQNPPRSIASATSAGGVQSIPIGPTAAFDNIFTR